MRGGAGAGWGATLALGLPPRTPCALSSPRGHGPVCSARQAQVSDARSVTTELVFIEFITLRCCRSCSVVFAVLVQDF